MTQEKALTVQSPTEVNQERLAALVVFGPEDGDGKGLSVAEAGRRLGISPATANAWWRTRHVQALVREYLDANRKHVQVKAQRLADKALSTLEKAMDSPAFTPTQRAAAKDILVLALGTETTTDVNVGLVVNVGTTLPPTLLAQQQKRAARHEDVVEGEALELETAEV